MRIYKATYKDRTGKERKTAKWYLDFSDHNQLRHKMPAAKSTTCLTIFSIPKKTPAITDAFICLLKIAPRGFEPLLPG